MLLALKITIFILGIVIAATFKSQRRRLTFLVLYYAVWVPIDAYLYFKDLLTTYQIERKPWPMEGFYLNPSALLNSHESVRETEINEYFSNFYVDLSESDVLDYLDFIHYYHIFLLYLTCIIVSKGFSDILFKLFIRCSDERA